MIQRAYLRPFFQLLLPSWFTRYLGHPWGQMFGNMLWLDQFVLEQQFLSYALRDFYILPAGRGPRSIWILLLAILCHIVVLILVECSSSRMVHFIPLSRLQSFVKESTEVLLPYILKGHVLPKDICFVLSWLPSSGQSFSIFTSSHFFFGPVYCCLGLSVLEESFRSCYRH